MKIALAQTNPIIGDFNANIAKMHFWITKAKNSGCSLVIFPELSISGYPPQDLLERPSFIQDQLHAFSSFTKEVNGIAVLCGLLTRHTSHTGKPLHNSAALIEDKKCRLFHKRLLPTYDVFDEARYFEPGQESRVCTFNNINLGITICEDILNDPAMLPTENNSPISQPNNPQKLYSSNPINDLLEDKTTAVQLLINIAASPFFLGKPQAKQSFFSGLAKKINLPLLYINQTGGQDSLLFDGQSMVINQNGSVIAKAAQFAEDMIFYDTDEVTHTTSLKLETQDAKNSIPEAPNPAADTYDALVMGCRDYVNKCGFFKVVLGLSGGIDSALTAAIACQALGKENVLGIALPSPYTSQESIEDAQQVAENLGINFEIIPIGDIFSAQLETLSSLFKGLAEDTTEQNIQARIRGNLLMAVANKFGYLLLSTGNKSEMAVGYCTLYGDMSGGLAVISDVPKTLVYKICTHINLSGEIIPARTISKPPSAELAPNQKDQDDLPPYEILDPILEAYLEENLSIREIIAQDFDAEVVKDVVRRVIVNEHKRKQAPMGLKVTSKAFGYGRRYPITQRYLEAQ